MIPTFIDKSYLPHKPGIYLFKGSQDQVLYVGKAVDLYSRVASYFTGAAPNTKTAHLLEKVSQVETIVVESELEALILEARLIKKHLPPFNVRLIDDKDYLYITITEEDFPKVTTARKKDLPGVEKYFGPFPSGTTVRKTLKMLRRVFPWCQSGYRKRACFYYHLGLCPGPCIGMISKEEYRKIITRFTKFLEGKKSKLLGELTAEMHYFSGKTQFEEAQKVKGVIDGFNYLTQPNRTSLYLQNPNFLEGENKQALFELQRVLNLKSYPDRIEAYDISNIQGGQASGSMVVLTNGEIDKSQYRKFKIRMSGRPNDVGMLKEMIKRRFTHSEWPSPQLVVVDGGRGQARAIFLLLQDMNLQIPIFGLAKRMDWLYPPEGEVVKLPKRSLGLRLLQRVRDESHRFALFYHRKLRQKTLLRYNR